MRGDFTRERVAIAGNVTGIRMPSMFDFVASPSAAIVDVNTGEVTVLRAHEAVTQATRDHVEATGAVCSEWAIGSINVSDGTVGLYNETGMNVVLEEFFVANWWEGYVWNGTNPTSRNTSFVPSGVSTFPFLCSVPPAALEANLDLLVAANHQDNMDLIANPTGLAQWLSAYIVPERFTNTQRNDIG